MWPEAFVAGLAGLLIGSFLNVCIYRLPRDLSIVRPRSHCPECEQMVRSWDNIPLLSFILLRGKCRDCGAAISWRYPAVELLTGALFFAFVFMEGLTPLALRNCLFSAILLTLIFTDLETRLLPESLTIGGIAMGLIFSLFVPVGDGTVQLLTGISGRLASFLDALLGAVIPAGALWLTGWLFEKIRHKQGLGLGDVVMIAEIGAFLGLSGTLLALVIASVSGAIIGIIYIKAKNENAASYHLPLGSFLGVAAIIVMLSTRSTGR
jgi:leader peptidase (prepilin peptidase) / N-methyltransferase